MQEKVPYEYVHSVRIELAKLILVGTKLTYQATGNAWQWTLSIITKISKSTHENGVEFQLSSNIYTIVSSA